MSGATLLSEDDPEAIYSLFLRGHTIIGVGDRLHHDHTTPTLVRRTGRRDSTTCFTTRPG